MEGLTSLFSIPQTNFHVCEIPETWGDDLDPRGVGSDFDIWTIQFFVTEKRAMKFCRWFWFTTVRGIK